MVTVGVDEVGRGCWAGPLVAGAVVLESPIAGLKDSKKLSKQQREKLAAQIEIEALAFGLGWVWPEAIDRGGITAAVKSAMEQALAEVLQQCPGIDQIVVDGSINYLQANSRAVAIIKADDTVPAVSAASIVAKVARDRYMTEVAHKEFPTYAFDRHVGYGTAAHIQSLSEHGVSELHRKSFKPVAKLLGNAA